MKPNHVLVDPKLIFLALSLCLAAPALWAQTNLAGLTPRQIAANQTSLTAWDSPDQPIGPNHRTTRAGTHKIVELTTGLNFWDGSQWSPSQPGFVADSAGFYAGKTQHQVYLAANLGTSNAVTVITPEGLELNSTPVAIALYDAASGNFSVIASITNCAGELLASNQVIYPDAFSGGVCADVVYTITAGSFHQDVVFTGSLDPATYGFPDDTTRIQIITEFYAPPTPEVTTNLVSTESGGKGKKAMASPDLVDEELGFGRFVMTRGRAYTAPSEEITNGVDAPVAKQFVNANGTHYLVESVPYTTIAAGLAALPPCTPTLGLIQPKPGPLYAGISPSPGRGQPVPASFNLFHHSYFPPPQASSPTPRASAFLIPPSSFLATGSAPSPGAAADALVRRPNFREHGVVIDYVANIGGTMSGLTTFQADTTYLVSGAVICNGGAVIEGGTVVKYRSARFGGSITLGGAVTFKTGMFRPAVFTAVDDDSIGDSMTNIANSYYTGSISPLYYASPALVLPPNFNASGLRFCYAKTALQTTVTSSGTGTLANAQFVHCLTGLLVNGDGGATPVNYNVENCLFTGVSVPFAGVNTGLNVSPSSPTADAIRAKTSGSGSSGGSTSFNPYINIYNSTVDLAPQLGSMTGNGYLFLTAFNSIFADITNLAAGGSPSQAGYLELGGTNNGFFNDNGGSGTFGALPSLTSTTPFQTVGAGNYYLTSASGFQTLGLTNNLPANVLGALALRTTYPPLVTNSLTETAVNWVLNPVVPRDAAGQSLGYHYDPLDYAFGSLYLVNSTVTVTNGAAIATFGTNGSFYGLGIGSGSSFTSFGAPNNPNWLALYNTVMEGTNNWSRPTNSVTGELYGATPPPTIYTRFTSWSVPANDVPQFFAPDDTGPICFQDNEFHGGKLISAGPTIDLTNCLLERVYASLASTDGLSPWIQNCTFRGGTFNFAPNVSTATVENNLFDTTNIPNNSVAYTGGYNAYISSVFHLAAATGDKTLSASPAYQTGTLGKYYLPPGSPLLNGGNPAANLLGLYEYTTQTNQTKETNSTVDIGYHYAATDGYGNPLDTLWYGIPDYLADTNGSGGLETWEMEYFGQLGLNPTASDDGQGGSLLSDYLNGTVPNVIQFHLESTNDYVNRTTATLQVNMDSGVAAYYSLSINQSAPTSWLPFTTTNLAISIGPTDGTYNVVLALSRSATDTQPVYNDYSFILDRVPPVLTITNPVLQSASATVAKPYLQLQGSANEQLSGITYDISNALGSLTFQDAYVTDQGIDTNLLDITTNFFQAYDIPLTNGLNQITLRATDRAGNTTLTNINVTLDYSTAVAPAVNLIWPKNGMAVSGSTMTIRGTMSDETGTIAVQTTDANGNSITIPGIVERNNMFWAENVPLNGSTQTFDLEATNAAGVATSSTFTIIPATTVLTIESTPTGSLLYQPNGTVSGTVGNPDATVTVNGMAASVDADEADENEDGTYNWTVANAPIFGMGTATFDVEATVPTGGTSGSTSEVDISEEFEMPPIVITGKYNYSETASTKGSSGSILTSINEQKSYVANLQPDENNIWESSFGGSVNITSVFFRAGTGTVFGTWTQSGSSATASANGAPPQPINLPDIYGAMQIPDVDWVAPVDFTAIHYYANNVYFQGSQIASGDMFTESLSARTVLRLYTGGKASVNRKDLFQLNVDADEYQPSLQTAMVGDSWIGASILGVNSKNLFLMNSQVGSDGILWKVLPSNSPIVATVTAPGIKHYFAEVSPAKYKATIIANGNDLSQTDPEFCVGQNVTFTLTGLPFGNIVSMIGHWVLPQKYVNHPWQQTQWIITDPITGTGYWSPYGSLNYNTDSTLLQNTNQTSCWFVNGQGGRVAVGLGLTFNNGQYAIVTAQGSVSVFRPSLAVPYGAQAFSQIIPVVSNGWMELGNASAEGGDDHGVISFNALITSEPPFTGVANVTQLYNRNLLPWGPSDTSGQFDLDTQQLYNNSSTAISCFGTNPNPRGVLSFYDSPGVATFLLGVPIPIENISDKFQTYLIFEPDGQKSIWVTLGIVTWAWNGCDYNNSLYSSGAIQPIFQNIDTFPTWSNSDSSAP